MKRKLNIPVFFAGLNAIETRLDLDLEGVYATDSSAGSSFSWFSFSSSATSVMVHFCSSSAAVSWTDRLARLAQSNQILVVTHSPQVAARGAGHMLIAKASDGTVTRTGVHALSDGERREEIARMLSGAEITAEARAQADRLLEV